MRAIIAAFGEGELLLKGGAALMFGYGIDRFSDDIDFDANKPIRDVEKKIARVRMPEEHIIRVYTLNITDTVGRYRVQYSSPSGIDSLNIEISYHNRFARDDVNVVDGLQVALCAGRSIRNRWRHTTARTLHQARDLYDLEFLSTTHPGQFNEDLAKRFRDFTADPERLFSIHRPAFQEDDLISSRTTRRSKRSYVCTTMPRQIYKRVCGRINNQ